MIDGWIEVSIKNLSDCRTEADIDMSVDADLLLVEWSAVCSAGAVQSHHTPTSKHAQIHLQKNTDNLTAVITLTF